MKSINNDEFFKLVSTNSGVDLYSVKHVFYGMIKTMSRELKGKRVINLPDWGEFRLEVYKSRTIKDVNTGMRKVVPPCLTLRFKPDYKVKRYFYELGK